MKRAPGIACVLAAAWAVAAIASGADDEPAVQIHGIDPANMDPSVSSCQDLNLYANGGWLKANPIPPDKSLWSPSGILRQQIAEQLRGILERSSKASNSPGSDNQKIGDFYFTCMDESAVEAQGAKPLEPEFETIEKISNPAELQAEIARLQIVNVNAVFGFGSIQDFRNASEVIAGASQGGLGLPERDYYLKTDDESKKLRDQYVAHVTKMFELLGDDPSKAAASARSVLQLETKLAQASMSPAEQRDLDKTYNRKTLSEIDRKSVV